MNSSVRASRLTQLHFPSKHQCKGVFEHLLDGVEGRLTFRRKQIEKRLRALALVTQLRPNWQYTDGGWRFNRRQLAVNIRQVPLNKGPSALDQQQMLVKRRPIGGILALRTHCVRTACALRAMFGLDPPRRAPRHAPSKRP